MQIQKKPMYPGKEHLKKTDFSDKEYEDLSKDPLHLYKLEKQSFYYRIKVSDRYIKPSCYLFPEALGIK